MPLASLPIQIAGRNRMMRRMVIDQFDASRDYDPGPALETIRAPLVAINSADDQVNPPELGILEREIRRVPRGRAVLLPISDQSRGHGTHSWPVLWPEHLAALLRDSQPRATPVPSPAT